MTTLTSPHDLIAAIPFLIGYHPVDSLVVVSIKDNFVGMAMRVDYPTNLPASAYDLLASHLQREGSTGALLVAYVPSNRNDGEVVLSDLAAALTRIDVAMRPSFTWSFGDGTFTTTTDPGGPYPDGRITHVYSNPGTYPVILITTWGGSFEHNSIERTITGQIRKTSALSITVVAAPNRFMN